VDTLTLCDRAAADNALAPRECQILAELVDGRTEATIAQRLVISPHTVHAHIRSLYIKLRVHNRVELIRCVFSYAEDPSPFRESARSGAVSLRTNGGAVPVAGGGRSA